MVDLLISAFVLGVVFNAAPGAILTETIRRGLKDGFSSALAVQLGSLVGDALWVVLGLLGASALFLIPYVQIPLSVAGAMLLGWLALESFRDSRADLPDFDLPFRSGDHQALWTGVALSISNPLNIIYWAALGGVITAVSGERAEWTHFAIFVVGFMLSSVLWCFFAAGVIALTRRRLSISLWRGLHLACGLALMFMAAEVLRRLITTFS